jgi:hypothetical protein
METLPNFLSFANPKNRKKKIVESFPKKHFIASI